MNLVPVTEKGQIVVPAPLRKKFQSPTGCFLGGYDVKVKS